MTHKPKSYEQQFLGGTNPAVKKRLRGSRLLSDFFRRAGNSKGLTLRQRQTLVEQALVLLEMNYAHLPLKRAIHAIEPIQRLKLLKFRLADKTTASALSEFGFHEEMQRIFTSLRDFHTNYSLPSPFDEKVAFLPFLVEQFFEGKKRTPKFLVTQVKKGLNHPTFKIGVEVLFWNGVPIKEAIELNGERQAGSNSEAKFAAGLSTFTIRSMIGSLPPAEHWVVVTYRSLDGEELEHKLPWLIVTQRQADALTEARKRKQEARRLGVDLQRSAINDMRKILFAPEAVAAEKKVASATGRRVALKKGLETSMPSVLRASKKKTDFGTYGYLRIFHFEAEDGDKFVAEVLRLVEALPQEGLIIDVRGNGGGFIDNGERLLQLFTPKSIEPELFEFVNSPLNLDLCRTAPKDQGLSPFADSIAQSVLIGSSYSVGLPLTSKELCNEIGQRYFGPVILIIDALCYSTTDMFAAGFQDHNIGDVLGADGNTGAGGGNVWDHGDLLSLMRTSKKSPYRRLPGNAGMRVALLRSLRMGQRSGTPLEDLGVIPDDRHYMTKRDLLEGNMDLINHAAENLSKKRVRQLSVDLADNADGTSTLTARTLNLTRVDFYVNGRPEGSAKVVDDQATFADLRIPKASTLIIQGFDRNNLVAARRIDFEE